MQGLNNKRRKSKNEKAKVMIRCYLRLVDHEFKNRICRNVELYVDDIVTKKL